MGAPSSSSPFSLPELQEAFNFHKDPEKAAAMAAYMKNKFPFTGLPTPLRRELQRPFLETWKKADPALTPAMVKQLWNLPEREYQYVAADFLEKTPRHWPADFLPLLEYLITHKSWWDTVDGLAASITGPWLQKHPSLLKKTAQSWTASNNMWLNRSAMLLQLKYRDQTDFALLCSTIEPHLKSKEFFLQKAIGWVLRQYAKTNAAAVQDYVYNTPLPALSRREALKHF